ncbi:MAG: hypothetical protein ACTHP8_06665 [Bosea sp. (in: a-proteobacteria)]|uniref:hypothetical protein n=1 Tax=Bosea sp. (in: a-proteobacteria) TaxID=1871050 RepID=UPI003F7C377C
MAAALDPRRSGGGCREPANETRKRAFCASFPGFQKKEARSVKKTSSSVLTSNPAVAYNAAIETAPPLSGASSALPKDVGLRPVRRVMSCRFCEALLFDN